jgi:hypothetical protein
MELHEGAVNQHLGDITAAQVGLLRQAYSRMEALETMGS